MKKILLYILLQCGVFSLFAQGSAQLYVHAPVLAPEDTLVLYLQKERIVEAFRNSFQSEAAANKQGVYAFQVDLENDWTWVGMNLSYQQSGGSSIHTILKEVLLEVGDSVHIYLQPKEGVFQAFEEGYNGIIPRVIENWDARFAGRGSAKYEALWEIKLLNELKRKQKLENKLEGHYAVKMLQVRTQIKEESRALLEKYKPLLKPTTYTLLEGQVLGLLGYEFGNLLKSLNRSSKNKGNTEIRKYWDAYLDEARELIKNEGDKYILAPMYTDYMTEFSWLVYLDQHKVGYFEVKDWYNIAKDLFPLSVTRDRVLANLLLQRFQYNPDKDLLEDAFTIIKDELSLNRISPLRNLLQGSKAYAFSLPDADGKYHRLEDYTGKVVFMDFWFAVCLPCQTYMTNVLRPVKEMYQDNPNVVFITVSIDDLETFKSMLAKDSFLPKGGIHLYTDGQYAKHPIIQHYQIQGYPFPMLIGKDGTLRSENLKLKKIKDLKNEIELALKE